MKVLLLIFSLCLGTSFGFVEFDRPCRTTVTAKENFNPSFYTGIWYEILHSLAGNDDDMVQCTTHHYTRRALTPVFDAERTGVFRGNFISEESLVTLAFPEEEPLRALFNGTIHRINGAHINYFYRIYATDYTNYAIAWSCTDLPNDRSKEELSVLGRGRTLSDTVYRKTRLLLDELEFEDHVFRYILHSPEACGL